MIPTPDVTTNVGIRKTLHLVFFEGKDRNPPTREKLGSQKRLVRIPDKIQKDPRKTIRLKSWDPNRCWIQDVDRYGSHKHRNPKKGKIVGLPKSTA